MSNYSYHMIMISYSDQNHEHFRMLIGSYLELNDGFWPYILYYCVFRVKTMPLTPLGGGGIVFL